ncbi:MAG TPA: RNA methyltransferase [bacterium]|nr:RNA methyltransferase [bacterium]
MKNIFLALVHYPVLRDGSVITSSLTNLNIHDISRVSSTYGLGGYFIVHPDEKMRTIANKLAGHWVSGEGKVQNPDRSKALEILHIVRSLEDVVEHIEKISGMKPLIIGTSARKRDKTITIKALKNKKNLPALILFGTAGGIDDKLLDSLDYCLEPIDTGSGYNHLSVRSAVSIFIDRLFMSD